MKQCGRSGFMAYDQEWVPAAKLKAAMELCDEEDELTVGSMVDKGVAKNTMEAHMILTVLFGVEKLYPIGKSRFVSHGKKLPVVVWRRRKSRIQVRSSKGLQNAKKSRKKWQENGREEPTQKGERVVANFDDF